MLPMIVNFERVDTKKLKFRQQRRQHAFTANSVRHALTACPNNLGKRIFPRGHSDRPLIEVANKRYNGHSHKHSAKKTAGFPGHSQSRKGGPEKNIVWA